MRPFPPAPELECLVGDMIFQIALDPNGVQLRLDSGGSIVSENRIEHGDRTGKMWSYDCESFSGPPLVLHRLICKRITAVDRESDLRITLRFEDGQSLAVLSEVGPYESGNLTNASGKVTVF